MGGPLGDSHRIGEVSQADAGVVGDTQKNVGVICGGGRCETKGVLMTDPQAPQVPSPVNGQRRREGATRLSGEFEFDLTLRDAADACSAAVSGLGWPIKTVDPTHFVSYADTASTQHPPKIEVELRGSGETTDVRITGTDRDAGPHQQDGLIAELDRVRDAIKAEAEAIEAPAKDAAQDPITQGPPPPSAPTPTAAPTSATRSPSTQR
jgi:hypothetical protein